MNQDSYIRVQEGSVQVHGPLTFATVAELFNQSTSVVQPTSAAVTIDMQNVSRADSAGLALMVEWLRVARAMGRQLRFVNVPAQLRRLIRVSGLEGAFAID